jgi:hypothetical protein
VIKDGDSELLHKLGLRAPHSVLGSTSQLATAVAVLSIHSQCPPIDVVLSIDVALRLFMAPLRPVGAKARRNKLLWLLGVGVLFGLYYHHSIIVAFTSGSAIAPTGCSQASSTLRLFAQGAWLSMNAPHGILQDKEDIHHLLADDPGSAADSIQLPPDVPPDLEQRCRGTAGGWCEAFYRQPLVPARPPPQDNQSCLWNCNFVGVCNHRTGICRCPAGEPRPPPAPAATRALRSGQRPVSPPTPRAAGWTGDDCSTRQVRPCSQHARVDGSWEPYRAPPNITSELVNMDTACASQCDEDTGHCFCDADTAHGRVPAPLDSLPGGCAAADRSALPRPRTRLCQPCRAPACCSCAWHFTPCAALTLGGRCCIPPQDRRLSRGAGPCPPVTASPTGTSKAGRGSLASSTPTCCGAQRVGAKPTAPSICALALW